MILCIQLPLLFFATIGAIIRLHHSSDAPAQMREENVGKLADRTSDSAFVVVARDRH